MSATMDVELLTGDVLAAKSVEFAKKLSALKGSLDVPFKWYPYHTTANFHHLREVFNDFPLKALTTSRHVADIGAADGDLAFFMQSLGFTVDVIDYPPTNFNGCKGVRKLIQELGVADTVNLHEMDIDSQFTLPSARYEMVFLLGILYHLKNPFYVLEKLARSSRHLALSTRVARIAPGGTPIRHLPVAYLVDSRELNNNPTNYWVFSETGLNRIVNRAGWDIVYSKTQGDRVSSSPSDKTKDERAFYLLK